MSLKRAIERLEVQAERLPEKVEVYRPTPEEVDELLARLRAGASVEELFPDDPRPGLRIDTSLLRDGQLTELEELLPPAPPQGSGVHGTGELEKCQCALCEQWKRWHRWKAAQEAGGED